MVSDNSYILDGPKLAEYFAKSIGSSAFGKARHINVALTLITKVLLVLGFGFILDFFCLFEGLVVLTSDTSFTLSFFDD
jgi:hypothetical protein